MLIGGISSTLSAQIAVKSVAISNGTVDGEKGVYEAKVVKDSPLSVTTMHVELTGFPTTKKSETVYFGYNETAQYLGLPTSYTFTDLDMVTTATKTFKVTVKNDWNMPNSVNGSKGIIYANVDKLLPAATTKTDTSAYYNYPTFKVEYTPTTTKYIGSLKVASISGSNPKYDKYMERKLLKDNIYAYLTQEKVSKEFPEIEVANLNIGDKILVKTPWETYVLDIPGIDDEVPPGTITRPVNIPAVSNAILSVETGIIMVPSAEDFSFTIKPTGSNVGLIPVVTTDRTSIPDSEGVTYRELSDGSWLITITRVQTPVNLSISFTTKTSNASVESNSVWANGGLLYVSAVTSSKASIYSITGALVKTANIAAGETANISLPTGLYVVTVNGKAYKVTVK